MAHYHARPRGHTPPDHTPTSRSAPAGSAQRSGPAGQAAPAARIDCDTCPVAGRGCAGCMVALLGPVRLRLDVDERRAVDTLVAAGLVSADDADSAYAVPDLPDWMVAARQHDPDLAVGHSLRAIG